MTGSSARRNRPHRHPLQPIQGRSPSAIHFLVRLPLFPGSRATGTIRFENKTETGIISVKIPPGSTLTVNARDLYSKS